MKRNGVIVVAMLLVFAMWIGGLVFGLEQYWSMDLTAQDKRTQVTVTMPEEDDKVEEAPEKEAELRVLLVDRSGSMDDAIAASAGYDVVKEFSEYLNQTGGDSRIVLTTSAVLDLGVKELGVLTDLDSDPAEDWNAAEGKMYSNVELTFFLSKDAKAENVKKAEALWKQLVDRTNSTLIFVNFDGSKNIVYDNYGKELEKETEKVEKAPQQVTVEITEPEDTKSVPKDFAILVGEILFTIIMALIEVILTMLLRDAKGGNGVPDDINQALKNPTGLDGSASVSGEYRKMLDWAKKAGVTTVYRFASDVQQLSLSEAESKPADGGTYGWTCLKAMADAGYHEITIVSDLGFNDSPTVADGESFDAITIVVPKSGYNIDVYQKIASMSRYCKVIEI